MSPVAVCDVGVFFEEEGDLFVGVQPNPVRQQHRPVLVVAQLNVVGSLQQLLGHLQQHFTLGSTDESYNSNEKHACMNWTLHARAPGC